MALAVVNKLEREVLVAERSVERLRWWETREADKWFRRFDRGALLVLVVVVVYGFHLIGAQNGRIQQSREAVSNTFCKAINRNAAATNANTRYIEGLIVSGARSSKLFEPVYRRYGAPPYGKRLSEAEKQAARLDGLQVPALNCPRFLRDVAAAGK